MSLQDPLIRFSNALEPALREASLRQNISPDAATMINSILAKLPNSPVIKRPQNHTNHTACRVLGAVFQEFNNLTLTDCPALSDLGRTLMALEPTCAWQQNPNYNANNQSKAFVEGQAYQAYYGPEGLSDAHDLAVFSMLMTDGVTYKEHSHPAEELYFILSGSAVWKTGCTDSQILGAGSLVHHPSGMTHATKTTSEPMLCLAFWIGNLEQRAKVI